MLSACWSALLLVLYLWQSRAPAPPIRVHSLRQALAAVVVIALLARLLPHMVLPMGAGYDIESYMRVGEVLRQGSDVYTHPLTSQRHPYLPFLMYWMALSDALADRAALPFVLLVRLLPIVADTVIAATLCIGVAHRQQSVTRGLSAGLLYAFNPVPVFVSAYHGQFDALAVLGVLLATMLVRTRPGIAGLWLGFGVLVKSWPVLAAPTLLWHSRSWRMRGLFFTGMATVPLVGLVIYGVAFHGDVQAAMREALGYNWGIGVWGYTYFARVAAQIWPDSATFLAWLNIYGRYLTLLALALVWLHSRSAAPPSAILTIFIAFLAFTHAFSIQYLMWPVALAILAYEYRWLERYTIAAYTYMLLVYTTFILEMHITRLMPLPAADIWIIMPAGLPAWLTTVGWLVHLMRKKSLNASSITTGTTYITRIINPS